MVLAGPASVPAVPPEGDWRNASWRSMSETDSAVRVFKVEMPLVQEIEEAEGTYLLISHSHSSTISHHTAPNLPLPDSSPRPISHTCRSPESAPPPPPPPPLNPHSGVHRPPVHQICIPRRGFVRILVTSLALSAASTQDLHVHALRTG